MKEWLPFQSLFSLFIGQSMIPNTVQKHGLRHFSLDFHLASPTFCQLLVKQHKQTNSPKLLFPKAEMCSRVAKNCLPTLFEKDLKIYFKNKKTQYMRHKMFLFIPSFYQKVIILCIFFRASSFKILCGVEGSNLN